MTDLLIAQIGDITNPFATLAPTATSLTGSTAGSGAIAVLNSIFRFSVVFAGIYTFFNFVLAGYQFLSAGGEPKNISKAWEKIWQSTLGLLIIAGSLVLSAVIGWLIFRDPGIIIRPRIYGP